MDTTTLYRRTTENWQRVLEGVGADQWTGSTPCVEWDVRTLVNHVVGEECWVPPLLAGQTIAEVGDQFDGDVVGDDPVAAGRDRSAASIAAVELRLPAGGKVNLSYGEESAEEYVLQVATDHLIHAWDLACGTGQDRTMDPELVAVVAEWFSRHEDEWRAGGAIGPRAELTGDPQVDLLAVFGRSADWVSPD
jgi:uncharacterized protein (TIGR03086 family)